MKDSFTELPPCRSWQEWLDRFAHYASASGWQEFVLGARNAGVPPAFAASLYAPLLQRALINAMLCASVQLEESEALTVIGRIAAQGRQIHFDRPPGVLDRELRTLYRDSTREVARTLPGAVDLFEQVFMRYVRGDYDEGADANALLSQGRSRMADRAAALEVMSRAGVAALRGAPVWIGWVREGSPEFQHWARSVLLMAGAPGEKGPLGPVAEERARVDARIAGLPTGQFPKSFDDFPLLRGAGENELGRMADTWIELSGRDEPLSDDEIRAMGDQYEIAGEMAARIVQSAGILDMLAEESDEDDDSTEYDEIEAAAETLGLAVDVVGILRFAKPGVITALIGLVVAEDLEVAPWDLLERALTALQRIGAPALEQCFDFVRYSEDEDARRDMLRVLGVVGRGKEEVYQYLVNQFERVSWAQGKSDYALSLALLHDPRVTPLIVAGLRDPAIDDDDAWDLLDALQELGVTFYINRDLRAVNIPDYGVIEGVLPDDWQSREELRALEEEFNNLDLDDVDDEEDEDDDDVYDDVVYDADGTPRCPDCGQEMYYVNGRWVHELPPVKPRRPKSKSRY